MRPRFSSLLRLDEIAFLLCVERGRLESEAILCVESLREYGGACADSPLYAVAPRSGHEPAPETVSRLEELGAHYVAAPLVDRFADMPTLNKVTVAGWAERELDHETLVFTDTDCVFVNEPAELVGGDWLAAARPVDRRIAGSRGKGQWEPFWRKMYAELGVKSEPYVETAVGGMRIRAYWNTGLVAARRASGLFGAWERALHQLFDAERVHKRWPQFMDQISWAGVTADVHDQVRVLSPPYNYALRHRQALGPEASELDLSELVHVHYRLWFHLPDALEQVVPPFDPSGERYRWLDERLPLEPLIDDIDDIADDDEED